MPEVAEGKGCGLLSKGYIFLKKGTNKNERALIYTYKLI
jgi:hypothetical protein